MARVNARIDIDRAELDRQSGTFMLRRMGSWQRQTATQARSDVPVRTGNLGRSIREGTAILIGRSAHGSVRAEADYALYVHEGSRPHLIRPRRAKALRFQVGGRTVFAKLVRHPGTRARPFLRNAGERVAARMTATG